MAKAIVRCRVIPLGIYCRGEESRSDMTGRNIFDAPNVGDGNQQTQFSSVQFSPWSYFGPANAIPIDDELEQTNQIKSNQIVALS